jgi:CRISPR-associated endonuclease/helicase Cas3
MNEYFHFAESEVNLTSYAELACNQAQNALKKLGWLDWTPPQTSLSFEQLFPFPPRPLQQAIAALADNGQAMPPALVIVEAPTGEGKTEAAWYLADRWLAEYQQRGVYVAMPTQATSNQMLGRVKTFLEKRYPAQQTPLLLLHGDAIFSAEMEQMKLAAIGENSDETVVAHAWFLPKKRSLLAPFAVGTIDQSLLAVLQTKHFFVRLFGLSHKTVIFDEVHAYDTYMNTLLRRLLGWLRQMGTSVILLSATLPTKTRQALVEAYTGQPFNQPVEYPAITWATAQIGEVSAGVIPLVASQARTVNLGWINPEALLETIRSAVEAGGCVAVLCNTVNQSQAIYRLLEAQKLVPDDDLILFHARFPFYLRQKIEEVVLEKFGKPDETKPNCRPQKAIVVATQVIEQSLDLDFDLMISYLAPVDLLLQRAGRLHRHRRDTRPVGLETPRLLLVQPELKNDIPQLGVDGLVYAPYILLRSYLALQNKPDKQELNIPIDVQPLIEAVYSDALLPELSPAWEAELRVAKGKLDKEMLEQEMKARQNLIYPPEDEEVFWATNKDLDEDDPELHQALRALTRLTRPTVTLICLHQTEQGIVLEPGSKVIVELDKEPDYNLARELASRKVTISNWAVMDHFIAQRPPTGWQKHPMLRYFRPLVFVNQVYSISPKLSLRFDLKQGIIIQKERT